MKISDIIKKGVKLTVKKINPNDEGYKKRLAKVRQEQQDCLKRKQHQIFINEQYILLLIAGIACPFVVIAVIVLYGIIKLIVLKTS